MIVNGRHFLIFLSAVAGVESFTNTLTNSCSISFHTKKVYQPKQIKATFGLNSLAASEEESIETDAQTDVATEVTSEDSGSEDSNNKSATEQPVEDITKIAYVVNLSYDTPGYKLREIFNQHGNVQKLFMPKEKGTGRPKGIAFVTMSSEEERDITIEKLNGMEVDGRTIYVDKAKPRSEKSDKKDPINKKLYVGNISYGTTKEDLIEFFQQYGFVQDVYVPVDRETGAPRGFAFVTMKTDDADNAIENASGVELEGRTIEVKESLPRGQKAPPRQNKVSNDIKIYVGNLSFDTEEDTLRSLFEEFGDLADLYIPLDRYSGRPRGFAFVTMDKENAVNAIEATDGLEVDGRILRVNEAQPKGYSTPRYDDWDEEGDWDEEE